MYDNEYNRGIRVKLSQINKKAIDHENRINNSNNDEHKLTTRLEGMCMRKKNIHGGSGYAAATLDDRGYKEDSTHGAGVSAAGMSAAGISAAGISGAGVRPIGSGRKKKTAGSIMDTIGDVIHTVAPLAPLLLAAGKKTRSKKQITGGDLSMLHYKELKGQPALTAPAEIKETIPANAESRQVRRTTKADMPGSYIAGAKPARKPNARNELVKKVMKEHGLSLPNASKFVKEHNLYKK